MNIEIGTYNNIALNMDTRLITLQIKHLVDVIKKIKIETVG
jgi:hypothetical protein